MFSAAAFAGSWLLFTLELIAAKLLLPSFGGAAYVWTGSMMVFQGLLLAGYLYADAVLRRGRYGKAHWALLALPLFSLPLAASAVVGGSPLLSLTLALLRAVGLPFFALATTSTVLQGWYRRRYPADEDGAYALYAASNAGSLLALLSYPLLVEPNLTLPWQGRLWAAAYVAFGALHFVLLPPSGQAEQRSPSRISTRDKISWLLLSAGPSAALLAATNLLTLDFAAVPLLWVLPLSLYLLTFVLNFKRKPWYPARLSLAVLGVFTAWAVAMGVTVARSGDLQQRWQVLRRLWVVNRCLFLCAALFMLCLICHRALAKARPSQEEAPRYYAFMAFGGWLGSLLVAVLLPLLARRLAMPELDAALAGLLSLGALLFSGWHERGALAALTLVGVAGLGFYVKQSPAFEPGTKESLRNFYGYYRIVEKGEYRRFFHGNTLHGVQALDPVRRREPLLYFGAGSPAADIMTAPFRKAAIVGLGAGILAAYGKPGQAMDYFELDPDVEPLARRWFSYLDDSLAQITVTPGDARLSLSKSSSRYDLIVLDAFSGGAIPVHTLTTEAFALYESKLTADGVIAVHVTNRFLNLRPVLAAAARERGLLAVGRQTGFAQLKEEQYYSSWVVLTRDPAAVARLRGLGWDTLDAEPRLRPWTDGYASLLAALRR